MYNSYFEGVTTADFFFRFGVETIAAVESCVFLFRGGVETVSLVGRSLRSHGTLFFIAPRGFHPLANASLSKSGYQ
jgi:hypothetical protein